MATFFRQEVLWKKRSN